MSSLSAANGVCLMDPLICVFTRKGDSSGPMYLGREKEDGSFGLTMINANLVPSGMEAYLSKEELLNGYLPDPDTYQQKVRPRMREILKAVAWGDRYLNTKKYYSAEMEYQKALQLDEDHVRAVFGLGLSYLGREDKDSAAEVLGKIISLDAAFEAEHKHLFNEFGIGLRKHTMYPEAIAYYERALDMCETHDENLHFNLARAAAHQGLQTLAVEHLEQCLALAPRMVEALALKDYMERVDISQGC